VGTKRKYSDVLLITLLNANMPDKYQWRGSLKSTVKQADGSYDSQYEQCCQAILGSLAQDAGGQQPATSGAADDAGSAD